jgi:beta-phosphoglucomutase-like phosphatase (HAD superfamily)
MLFDLDGVLVDSQRCIEKIWRAWAAGKGLDPEPFISVAHGRRKRCAGENRRPMATSPPPRSSDFRPPRVWRSRTLLTASPRPAPPGCE